MNSIYKFTVISIAVLCTRADDNCPYKECLCTSDDIDCSDLGLTAVPQRVTKYNLYSTSLHLEYNEIPSIPSGILPPNLTDLYLMNNPLLTIDQWAFNESASTLGTVTLSNARFTRFPDAFLIIDNLIHLAIYNCNILDWNINVMKHIGRTSLVLELDSVGLTTWPGWIQYFSQLTELKIVDSSISDIPQDALASLANTLTSLSLYNNNLVSVPKALTQLKALQLLYLQGNKISDLTWLSQTNKLFSLTLSNNSISDADNLSLVLRSHQNTLFDFALNHNKLTKIPDLSFLQGVTTLDISYNNIADPAYGSLPSLLDSLDLSNNNLPLLPRISSSLVYITDFIMSGNAVKLIQGTDFPPSVTNVILSYNMITEINDNSFPQNSKIENLNLNNNPISTISLSGFQNLHNLTVLNLQNTKLTRIPVGLSSLTSLTSFDFSGTVGLVCTCNEKSLQSFITSFKPENVKGSCGLATIYNFFATLTADCPSSLK